MNNSNKAIKNIKIMTTKIKISSKVNNNNNNNKLNKVNLKIF